MNRDDIDRLWHQALHQSVQDGETFTRYHFAALVAAAEREAMLADGLRQCARGQRTTQFCGMAEQAVAAERKECAKVCDKYAENSSNPMNFAENCAAAIRARGQA